jgi:hypothetical protein
MVKMQEDGIKNIFIKQRPIILFLIIEVVIATIFALLGMFLIAASSSSIGALITVGLVKGKQGKKRSFGYF